MCGWVHRRRDHGGLAFLDLRDRDGLVQVVVNPQTSPGAHEVVGQVRAEFVLRVEGEVTRRPAGTENPRLSTGEVEVLVQGLKLEVLELLVKVVLVDREQTLVMRVMPLAEVVEENLL